MAVVKSADRVVLILEAIAESKTGLSHGEISRNLRIPGGSLSLLLSNLVTGATFRTNRSENFISSAQGCLS